MVLMEDLTGQKIHRLLVIKLLDKPSVSTGRLWRCRCDCGTIAEVSSGHLRAARDGKKTGAVKSCGCLGEEKKKSGNRKHGFRFTKEYHVWLSMRERCNNPKCKGYPSYGGRGIKVDPKWDNFENFIKDMGWRPSNLNGARFSIERIDNNSDYCPSNCRWATGKEQARNTRRNIFINVGGENVLLISWCEKMNLPYKKAYYALKRRNWDVKSLALDWNISC